MSLKIKTSELPHLSICCTVVIEPGVIYANAHEDYPEYPEAAICIKCLQLAATEIWSLETELFLLPKTQVN